MLAFFRCRTLFLGPYGGLGCLIHQTAVGVCSGGWFSNAVITEPWQAAAGAAHDAAIHASIPPARWRTLSGLVLATACPAFVPLFLPGCGQAHAVHPNANMQTIPRSWRETHGSSPCRNSAVGSVSALWFQKVLGLGPEIGLWIGFSGLGCSHWLVRPFWAALNF